MPKQSQSKTANMPHKTELQTRLTVEPSKLLSLLPDEVLSEILQHLDERSNVRAMLTCKKLFPLAGERVYRDIVCTASSPWEYEPNKISIRTKDAEDNHSRLLNLNRFKRTRESVESIKMSAYFAQSRSTFWNRLPSAYSYTTKSVTLLDKFPNLTRLSLTNHHRCYHNTVLKFQSLTELTLGVMSEKFSFAGLFVNSPVLSKLKLYYDLNRPWEQYGVVQDFKAFGTNQLNILTKRYLSGHLLKIDTTIFGIIDNRLDKVSRCAAYATCADLDAELSTKVERIVEAKFEIYKGAVICC